MSEPYLTSMEIVIVDELEPYYSTQNIVVTDEILAKTIESETVLLRKVEERYFGILR